MRIRNKTNQYTINDVGSGTVGNKLLRYKQTINGVITEYDIPVKLEYQNGMVVVNDYETMNEARGPRSPRGYQNNYVEHLKHRYSLSQNLDIIAAIIGTSEYKVSGGNAWFNQRGTGNTWFAPMDYRWKWSRTDREMISQAVQSFYNDNTVEGLLNVVEAPQLWSSAKSAVANISQILTHAMRNRRLVLSGAVASGSFLAYKFGIAPLIGDMQRIHTDLARMSKKCEAAIASLSMPRKVSSHCTGHVGLPDGTAEGISNLVDRTNGNTCHINRMHTHVEHASRRCVVTGYHHMPYSSKFLRKMEWYLRRYGASGPASYAWERIPFSFVVDWFVNTGAVLGGLDNALTGGNKVIDSVSISSKWNAETIVYAQTMAPGADWTEVPLLPVEIARNRCSFYRREPVHNYHMVSTNSRFGKSQGIITVALLLQDVANRLLRKMIK